MLQTLGKVHSLQIVFDVRAFEIPKIDLSRWLNVSAVNHL